MKKAITKIDLAVVLLCCVLILALSGAAGRAGRMRAKETMCLAKLGQWGVVFSAYVEDNEGYFHDRICVDDRVYYEYYQDHNLKLCPAATKLYSQGGKDPFAAHEESCDTTPASYGMNAWIINYPSTQLDHYLWKTPYVSAAANVPVYGDIRLYSNVTPFYSDEPPEYPEEAEGNGDEMQNVCTDRHNGGVQWLLADFSARKVGLKELWELQWHRNWNPNNDPPPIWPEWMSDFKDYR